MFKLVDLAIGLFAIVKASEEDSKMPMTAHGFIKVSDRIAKEYVAILLNGKMSKELEASNEAESLKEKAIELTEEAVADEFGD